MLIAFLAAGFLFQTSQSGDEPAFAFQTSTPAPAAANCVVSSLRGKRLGANIFTLRPQLSRIFGGYMVLLGTDIRVTIEPQAGGSDVRLYTNRFVQPLSEMLRQCEVLQPLSPVPPA